MARVSAVPSLMFEQKIVKINQTQQPSVAIIAVVTPPHILPVQCLIGWSQKGHVAMSQLLPFKRITI